MIKTGAGTPIEISISKHEIFWGEILGPIPGTPLEEILGVAQVEN